MFLPSYLHAGGDNIVNVHSRHVREKQDTLVELQNTNFKIWLQNNPGIPALIKMLNGMEWVATCNLGKSKSTCASMS